MKLATSFPNINRIRNQIFHPRCICNLSGPVVHSVSGIFCGRKPIVEKAVFTVKIESAAQPVGVETLSRIGLDFKKNSRVHVQFWPEIIIRHVAQSIQALETRNFVWEKCASNQFEIPFTKEFLCATIC